METFDPPTILTSLNSLITSLQNNPHIDLKHHIIGPPTLTTISSRLHLPTDLITFYTATSHFTVDWEYKGPQLTLASVTNTRTPKALRQSLKAYINNFAPQGSINILPLEDVFSSWEGGLWFPTETDKARGYDGWGSVDGDGEGWLYRFRHVKPFDLFMPEASVGFLMEWGEAGDGDGVGEMMAYHYHGEELEGLDLSFRGYLERLLVSRGFWSWHTLGEREVGVLAEVLFNKMDGKGRYDPDSSSEWEP
ncbi:hypothetical protein FQN50_004363 [Emmonsiellopsis sp. PD_5]|nr:hypothetical protein FQN50_004363 [Emmonsiellopsis sp. PD_5]